MKKHIAKKIILKDGCKGCAFKNDKDSCLKAPMCCLEGIENRCKGENGCCNNEQNKIRQIEILYKQAVSFFKEKKIEAAKNIYKEILLQDPGHINSLNDMGVLFLHEGRYEDAISYLEKAVKLKPKFANPFYNLACAYSLQSEGEKGMAYLVKAIEVDEKVKDWAKQDPDLQYLKEYAEFTLITN